MWLSSIYPCRHAGTDMSPRGRSARHSLGEKHTQTETERQKAQEQVCKLVRVREYLALLLDNGRETSFHILLPCSHICIRQSRGQEEGTQGVKR